MTEIKNREQVIVEFTKMLMQFDKDCNSYQTDVYMYIDDNGKMVTICKVRNNGKPVLVYA